MRSLQSLNSALEKFISSNADSLVSVREVPHEYNPHWTFTLSDNDNLKIATGENEIISSRQDLPKAYHRDGSIYITKTSVILEGNSLYGNTIAYAESKEEAFVNIDTLKDWEKAEKIFKSLNL
jgi:CMP-N,N'-diacetyllegionaminic acid synthase